MARSGARPHGDQGWQPADLVAAGCRCCRGRPSTDRDELVFRALLRRPQVLYGHHWDFAEGLDGLERQRRVGSRGGSMGGLGRDRARQLSPRRARTTLELRLCTRRPRAGPGGHERAAAVRTAGCIAERGGAHLARGTGGHTAMVPARARPSSWAPPDARSRGETLSCGSCPPRCPRCESGAPVGRGAGAASCSSRGETRSAPARRAQLAQLRSIPRARSVRGPRCTESASCGFRGRC